MRVVFAGTPEFAAVALQALLDRGITPVAALTQPDRKAGRGQKLLASPVKTLAQAHGVPVHQPLSLKHAEEQRWLADLQPDLMIVVAYGLILPTAILDTPRYGCWNIHASLLPRWRGAAPIQRAIQAGDTHSGVCIMQMDAGLDTGPVLMRRTTELQAGETAASLHDRLAVLGGEALLQCLDLLQHGELPAATPQDSAGVSYATKLDKAEARLDWSRSALQLERTIRAFNPWPVAWCDIDGERTRIWAATALQNDSRQPSTAQPGRVISAGPQGIDVTTGEGLLRLQELQRPGGRRISAADYLNARTLPEQLTMPIAAVADR